MRRAEPVGAERAERDREHDGEGLREPHRTQEHGAHRADERDRGGSGRGGTEPGVAPRRPEAVEQVADARPVTEGADGRDPAGDDAAGADGDEHEESEERDRGRRAHAVGHGVDRDARRVTDGPEPGVGLQVLGEERAEPGGARDLQLAQLGVVHPPELLRAAARRLQGAHVQEVGVPAADGGPRPARMPGEQVAERLDEPDHEPERHQPQQAPQRVRREQHPHARAGERELVGPVAERTLVGRLPVRRTRVGRRPGRARPRAGRASRGRGPRHRGTSRGRSPRAPRTGRCAPTSPRW